MHAEKLTEHAKDRASEVGSNDQEPISIRRELIATQAQLQEVCMDNERAKRAQEQEHRHLAMLRQNQFNDNLKKKLKQLLGYTTRVTSSDSRPNASWLRCNGLPSRLMQIREGLNHQGQRASASWTSPTPR